MMKYFISIFFLLSLSEVLTGQMVKIFPNDPLEVSSFGHTVLLDGDRLAVVSNSPSNQADFMRTYLFKKENNNWIQKDILEEGARPKHANILGRSLTSFEGGEYVTMDITEKKLLIYNCENDIFEIDDSIEVQNNSTYNKILKFVKWKDWILCRANKSDTINYTHIVDYFYQKVNDEWILQDSFPHINYRNFNYTIRLRMSNNIALISSKSNILQKGSVFVYKLKNGQWNLFQEIFSPDLTNGDPFTGLGLAKSEDNKYISIGTEKQNIYMFILNGDKYEFEYKIEKPVENQGEYFAYSIDMKNDNLFVGYYNKEYSGIQGKVIQYSRKNSNWERTNEIKPPSLDSNYYHFGESLECDGDRLVVAADYDNTHRYVGGAVFIFNVPAITQFIDTICQGDSYLFNNSIYFDTGLYTDTLTTIYGADSIISLVLTVIPQEYLVIDTILCYGDSIQIGDSIILESGHYEFYYDEIYNCQSSAIIDILLDTLELKDTIISDYGCNSGEIDLEIEGNNPPFSYSWGDGEVTEDLSPLSSGFYNLEITTNSECKYDFVFEVKEEKDLFIVPNAFFPSGLDEINKTFKVYLADSVNIVSTKIFNRWGEKVYQSNDNSPWDGTYKGIPQPPEVYLYEIIVNTPCGSKPIIGQVMLLR